MKIKLNAIGYGERKWILIAEGFIYLGLFATAAGLILMNKTQCWTFASNSEGYAYFKDIAETLDKGCK